MGPRGYLRLECIDLRLSLLWLSNLLSGGYIVRNLGRRLPDSVVIPPALAAVPTDRSDYGGQLRWG